MSKQNGNGVIHNIAPHGGVLVNRLVPEGERASRSQAAQALPKLTLGAREISDLFLLAIGAFSPLQGFLGQADHDAVVKTARLANGLPWSIPISLRVTREVAARFNVGDVIGLYDKSDGLLGTLELQEKFEYDKNTECQGVYGTTETKHPGVAVVQAAGDVLLAGPITLINPPAIDPVYRPYLLRPIETRYVIREKGWRTAVAFQTRNPIHRAHEYIQRCALEMVDGMIIHPLVGETKADDIPAPTRMRCYRALIDNYYPPDRVLLSVFPAAMRYAGPREAIFHSLVRKNYGFTHIIIGRDHAGVGNYYGPYDAHRIFDNYTRDEIGIQPLFFDFTFHCRKCGHIASEKTCRHGEAERLSFSGTKVREMLRNGEQLPVEFTRPEIAAILLEAEREKMKELDMEMAAAGGNHAK